ncbi:MAG: hypothetical protein KDI68_15700 [Gammaproteobacteria bacterium]|nr:hypothetical protein [Gammaproteobacteria bacterium]
MKSVSFVEGIVVALVAALGASLCYSSAILLLPAESALRLVGVLLSLGYTIYLLGRSRLRSGRVAMIALWLMIGPLSLTQTLPLSGAVLLHSGFVWLLRSRYLHAGPLAVLMDLGLVLLGLATASWAALQSGNLFLAVWSLFLVQALFIFIPNPSVWHRSDQAEPQHPFAQAYQSAQLALQRLNLRS